MDSHPQEHIFWTFFQCDQLWIGKAHIPRWAEVPGLSKLARYSRAVIDSKRVSTSLWLMSFNPSSCFVPPPNLPWCCLILVLNTLYQILPCHLILPIVP